ncbi:MAG: ABC transporter substrate-binding protein [Frankia sp.]|nr:ABC transporter substrate-binding protein [Frankia sp.]
MYRSSRLRGASALLGAALIVGALAGCGSDDDDDAGTGAGEGASRLPAPVTVEHAFGTATIDAVPERVVTLDLQWTDVMLSLGVTPVGHVVDSSMPESGVPWQTIPDSSEPIDVTDGFPVEQILALDPDLVLGSWIDQETYDLLSATVPTIAGEPDQKVTPWQDLVRTAGQFLNQPERAQEVIEETESAVQAAAAELPGLEGKTFALAQYIVGDSLYIVGDESDGSSLFFQAFGMKLFPPVLEESRKTGQVRVQASTERADLLRSDLLVFLINGGDESALADIPGFGQLPGTVAILDYPTIVGLNTPTPLSLPYSLDALRPYLEKAAAAAPAA